MRSPFGNIVFWPITFNSRIDSNELLQLFLPPHGQFVRNDVSYDHGSTPLDPLQLLLTEALQICEVYLRDVLQSRAVKDPPSTAGTGRETHIHAFLLYAIRYRIELLQYLCPRPGGVRLEVGISRGDARLEVRKTGWKGHCLRVCVERGDISPAPLVAYKRNEA